MPYLRPSAAIWIRRSVTALRARGDGRADVVGLVDDDQRGLPAVTVAPEPFDDVEGGDERLGPMPEAHQVEHRDTGARRLVGGRVRPDVPLGDPEILDALPQGPRLGLPRRSSAVTCWIRVVSGFIGGGAGGCTPRWSGSSWRTAAWACRGSPTKGTCSASTPVAPPCRTAVSAARIAASRLARCVLPRVAQVHVVSVGVEDDDGQSRVQDELLEDDPEGVRLPGAALAAEEGVPVEAAGAQPQRRVDRTDLPLPNRQVCPSQPGSARPRLR